MTSNQIKYWELREKHRNSKVTERENERSHRANEANTRLQINTSYNLGLMNLDELRRSNQAKEQELLRSHLADEQIRNVSNLIAKQNADTNRMNAQTNMGNLAELHRANLVKEAQNQQSIDEIGRHNLASEGISNFTAVTEAAYKQNQISAQRAKLEIESSQLEELIRHNKATEDEIKRKNLVDQELAALKLKEQITMDRAKVLNDAASNVSGLVGTLTKGKFSK